MFIRKTATTNLEENLKTVQTFNQDSVICSIKKHTIDASTLNITVEQSLISIVESQSNHIAHKLTVIYAFKRRIGRIIIKHMDAVNPRNSRKHDKGIII